jgi:hypothetical protein
MHAGTHGHGLPGQPRARFIKAIGASMKMKMQLELARPMSYCASLKQPLG